MSLCLLSFGSHKHRNAHLAQAAKTPFGIQSGLDTAANKEDTGSSFAAAMSYDANNDALFITGATYGTFWNFKEGGLIETNHSSCFFAILQLSPHQTTNASDSIEDNPSWSHANRLGDPFSSDSCSSILRVESNKAYLGGQAEEGGFLTNLKSPGSGQTLQYGLIADIDVDLRSDGTSTSNLLGGRVFHSEAVQSTKAITSLPLGDALFVVSQRSDLEDLNPDFDQAQSEPNLILQPKYGRNFFLKVQKTLVKEITNESSGTTLQSPSWTKEIATTLNPVNVAGIQLMSSSTLLLAGSAIGSNSQAIPESNTTDTWAGFVTLLDASNGDTKDALRIDRAAGRTVRVEGLCRQAEEESFIYLVGSTNGSYEIDGYQKDAMTAFLIRLRLPELTIEWSKQLAARPGPLSNENSALLGHRCAVTDDGKHVFVGGIVQDGSIVDYGAHQSQGQDDLWIGQVDTESKEWRWIRQLGTSQDESLSDLTVDKDGNVIVLGNTDGSFMRRKTSGGTDVFVISLSRADGDYPIPVESGLIPEDGGGPTTPAPTSPSVPSSSAPTPSPTSKKGPTQPIAPTPLSTLPPVPALEAPAPEAPDSGGGNAGAIAVAVVVSAIGIMVGCFVWQRRSQIVRESDGSQVLEYLKGFDDVEVDLKNSATGGWHGTYVNHDGGPRFYSGSGMPEETVMFGGSGNEMSPLTHSAIVEDSLFSMDDDDVGPQDFGGALARRKSSYKGLVDVYNNTWSDRSAHQLPGHQPSRPLVDVDIDEEEEANPWGRDRKSVV